MACVIEIEAKYRLNNEDARSYITKLSSPFTVQVTIYEHLRNFVDYQLNRTHLSTYHPALWKVDVLFSGARNPLA